MDTETKSELRKTIKSRLAALSREQFLAAGNFAAQEIKQVPNWDRFKSVLIFISMKDEIDTRPLMETILNDQKLLFIPEIEDGDLVFYQIKQIEDYYSDGDPALTLKLKDFPALVITPALAFDRRLNRLGRGRSFYDRFFDSLDKSGRDYASLGLCMDCQLVEKVPVDHWDKKLDMLLTESALILPN